MQRRVGIHRPCERLRGGREMGGHTCVAGQQPCRAIGAGACASQTCMLAAASGVFDCAAEGAVACVQPGAGGRRRLQGRRRPTFIWLSTALASAGLSHTMEKQPTRWPYRPMFFAYDCRVGPRAGGAVAGMERAGVQGRSVLRTTPWRWVRARHAGTPCNRHAS